MEPLHLTNKADGRHYRENHAIKNVLLPLEGIGECINAKNCNQWNTETANGYCIDCWDKGLGGLKPVQGLDSDIKYKKFYKNRRGRKPK